MNQGKAGPLARWSSDSELYCVAISHDATRVASGTKDCWVRVWDTGTGALVLGPLKGHEGTVGSLAFSVDNARIASGSWDRTIRLWDARIGTCIGEPFTGHTDTVWTVAFSQNGALLVSGSDDHTVRVWDAATGASIGEPLRGHTDLVRFVAFSLDSTRVISGSHDHTIRIWDVQTCTSIGESLKGHSNAVDWVAFSADESRIVSGSWDQTVRIWDAVTGAPVGEPLEGHLDKVLAVAFSPDGTHIISVSYDHTIRIWDARTGSLVDERLHKALMFGYVSSVVLSPDCSLVVSCFLYSGIAVWQVPRTINFPNAIVPDSPPSFDMLTSKMSAQDVFDSLVSHGCTNISSSIDPSRRSSSAVAFGGFGDVWQAWLRDGTMVAVKCLRLHSILDGDEKGMKRMARELYHWSKARHENIQELLGIIMFQDRLGMVSLWMENGNLQQFLERNPDVIRYPLCVQLAKGVAYMHGIGMVHGDLKALNVLVSAEGVLKINDFDYSMLSETTLRFSQTTKVGGGTVRWMAPELLLHQENDDSPPVNRDMRTDVYALGMTMLETISGKVPYYQFQYDVGIIRALDRKEPPRRPEQLSGPDERLERTWALLLACWDHDPSARPDASAVLETLISFAA